MTPDIVSFLIGLTTGGLVLWLAHRETATVLIEQLHRAQVAEAEATDRLVHAWREGATIPPRPQPIPPVQPLPPDLQVELDQWEDQEHKVMLEAQMRAGMARGLSSTAVLLELDNLHPPS